MIDEALQQAEERFLAKRPKTLALHAEAVKFMPGGNTRTVLYTPPVPIRIVKGEGAVVTDVDGHSYVDFLGEYSAGLYGHSHPRIIRAIGDAIELGLNLGAHHEAEVRLAKAVTQRFDLDLMRFTNSGTEANMMALGAARVFTRRPKIMAIKGGYHGGTLYFGGGSASPVNAPFDTVLARLNDVDGARALIRQHAHELAGVIIEPMLGSGGCFPATPEFVAMLRDETARQGIVLVFDEVMTSRLHPKGLSAALSIQPDLKTLGKYIGGGMSFGAFGGRREIMEPFDPSRPNFLPHAGTFNNNTLTMMAGHAALTEIFTADACMDLNHRGERLRSKLNDLFMRYQAALRATGMGSMMTIHPVGGDIQGPEDVAPVDPRLRQLLYLDLLEEGYYIAGRGFMALSLMIGDDHCEDFCAAMEKIISTRRECFKPN